MRVWDNSHLKGGGVKCEWSWLLRGVAKVPRGFNQDHAQARQIPALGKARGKDQETANTLGSSQRGKGGG